MDNYELKKMNLCFNRAFMKIFGTFDKNIITQCQMYTTGLDFTHLVDLQRLRFLMSVAADAFLPFCNPHVELSQLRDKYSVTLTDTISQACDKIYLHFLNYAASF